MARPLPPLVLAVFLAVVVLVGLSGTALAVCRFTSLDCHLGKRTRQVGVISATGQTSLPRGFVQDVVASGLSAPTGFERLPDGRILVAEKLGAGCAEEDVMTTTVREMMESATHAVSAEMPIGDAINVLIDKGVTVEQVAKVTRHFTENGILVHAYLMYG